MEAYKVVLGRMDVGGLKGRLDEGGLGVRLSVGFDEGR